jgi:hypothetical protein
MAVNQQVQSLFNQGTQAGNKGIFDLVQSGQVSMQDVANTIGQDKVDWYMQQNNLNPSTPAAAPTAFAGNSLQSMTDFANQAKTGVFNPNDPNEPMINSGEASTLLRMAQANNQSPEAVAGMLGIPTNQVVSRLQNDYPTLSADYLKQFGVAPGTPNPANSYLNAGQATTTPAANPVAGSAPITSTSLPAQSAGQPMQAPSVGPSRAPLPAPAAPGNLGTTSGLNITPGGWQTMADPTKYPTPIPIAPNYQSAASLQGQANLGAARESVVLSNPDVMNPYGSQTVSLGPDGRPVVNQSLSPEMQQRLNALNTILPGMSDQIATIMGNKPGWMVTQQVDAPTVGGVSSLADALRQREQPRMDRTRKQQEAQLLAQGFNPGTEAWNARMDDLNRAENDFNLGLIERAGQEQSRLFDLQSGLRGQQTYEEQLLRSMPIQNYAQLIQAMQPNLPQFRDYQGATVEAPPVFNAANAEGLFNLGRYGTMIQGELGTRGVDASKGAANAAAVGDLVGAGLTYMALSDARAKSNITRIGETGKGIPLYTWDWNEIGKRIADNQPNVGVIAQEVQTLIPDAVIQGADGYLRVNYAKVM